MKPKAFSVGFVGIALVGTCVISALFAYEMFWRTPAAKAKLPVLRDELRQISLPLDAREISNWDHYKGGSALTGVEFMSDLGWTDVERRCTEQMKRLGWTARPTKSLKVWGKDLGTKEKEFRKAELTASLFYRGSEARPGRPQYSMSVVWKSSGQSNANN